LDARTLHALTATVDEADLGVALFDGSFEVVFDHVEHVARLKTVQIDRVFNLEDRDGLGVVILGQARTA
jgi:hypothetical protein